MNMPLYDYRCKSGHVSEAFAPLANYRDPILCSCGLQADRVISRPKIIKDIEGYECPITGKWIGSRRAHRENLAQHGCRVMEPGEREEITKRKAAEEVKFDRKISKTVEKEIDKMPSAKREKLYNELVNTDLRVERL